MSSSRRIQLVKLLRAHGLRDVERMREHELKDVLEHIRIAEVTSGTGPLASEVSEISETHVPQAPSSSSSMSRSAEPPPVRDDSDDPWALSRFREPRVHVPEGQRTFVRAIAVKPRLLFCTWDVRTDEREQLDGPVELQVFWSEFLGEAPAGEAVVRDFPVLRIPVDLAASSWYVAVPGDRIAVGVALVVASTGRRIAESNLTLAPPVRPAPPGPHWEATLPPSLDRRRLRDRALFAGTVVPLRRMGEADARTVAVTAEEETFDDVYGEDVTIPASGSLVRSPRLQIRQARAGVPSSGGLVHRHSTSAGPSLGPAGVKP